MCIPLLRTLNLHDNQLSGEIPAALGSLPNLRCVAAVCVCCNMGGVTVMLSFECGYHDMLCVCERVGSC